MTAICRRATIHGRVQGVGYRAWAAAEATALGLAGFVRNRRDGTVEAVFCGPSGAVNDMLARCHRGPSHAHVTQIDISEADADFPPAAGEPFAMLPTL
jgi:acylphosphatase